MFAESSMAGEAEMLERLRQGPLTADVQLQEPVKVWVTEHRLLTNPNWVTRPVDGFPDLLWVLSGASRVVRDGSGVLVHFWSSSMTGWYPSDNVRLAV